MYLHPLVNCSLADCKCVAHECAVVFNASIQQKEDCFMDYCFISKRALDDTTLIQVTALYLVILFVGLVGNLMTCVVIKRHPLLKTNSNFYLINLAVSDLVTLCVGLPFEIVMNWNQYPWPFPDFVCNLKGVIAETTNMVSMLTILLFAVERYIAVCHPFCHVKTKPLRQNVGVFLVATWVVSIVCALPFGIHHRADFLLKSWPYTDNLEPVLSSKMCMIAVIFDPELMSTFKILFHFSALIFFAIPLSFILVLYVLISFHVSSSSRVMKRTESMDDANDGQRVTIILSAIVVAFFVCYLPFQLQRLLFFYFDANESQLFSVINHYIYFISGFLFYLATVINPILYNLVSTRFRKASKEVLLSMCRITDESKKVAGRASVRYTIALQQRNSRSAEKRTAITTDMD